MRIELADLLMSIRTVFESYGVEVTSEVDASLREALNGWLQGAFKERAAGEAARSVRPLVHQRRLPQPGMSQPSPIRSHINELLGLAGQPIPSERLKVFHLEYATVAVCPDCHDPLSTHGATFGCMARGLAGCVCTRGMEKSA
jgi:hypothetical protein